MAASKELNVHVLCGNETSIFRCKRSDFIKTVQEKFKIGGDIEIFDRKTSDKLTVETMKSVCTVEVKSTSSTSSANRVSMNPRDAIIQKLEQGLPLTDQETFCAISLLKAPVNNNNEVIKKNAKIQVKLSTQDKECQTDKVSVELPAKRKIENNDLIYQCKRLASTEKVDPKKVKELMDKLYDERRHYILFEVPLAAVVKEKYPLLFSLAEVKNEIDRIFHQGKCQNFLNNIEKYAKHILNLVREDDPLLLLTKRKIKSYKTAAQKNYAMKVGSVLIISSIMNEERKFLKLTDQPFDRTILPYIEAEARFEDIFHKDNSFKIYVENIKVCEANDLLEALLCLMGCYFIFQIEYPPNNFDTLVTYEQLYLDLFETNNKNTVVKQTVKLLILNVKENKALSSREYVKTR